MPPICSCSAGCRRGGSSISAAAAAARAGPGSSRSRSTTRRRSPRRCARQRPVRRRRTRRGRSSSGRTTRAARRSCRSLPDVVVVFGAADGERRSRRRARSRRRRRPRSTAVEPPGRAKELADELELLEAVRARGRRSCRRRRSRRRCTSSRRWPPRRSRASSGSSTSPTATRVSVAERGCPLACSRERARAALAERVERGEFPYLRPGRDGVRRSRVRSLPSAGIRSYYLLELTGPRPRRAARRAHRRRAARVHAALPPARRAPRGGRLGRPRRRAHARVDRGRGCAAADRLRRARRLTSGSEQRHEQQRHHVEPDVAGRDARRRVAVRDAEPGHSAAQRHVPIAVP